MDDRRPRGPGSQIRPPAWATRLLRAVLPDGAVGASVAADLDEEFRELLGRRSRTRARLWYVWETVKLAAHFGARAIKEGVRTMGRRGGWLDRQLQNVRLALRHFVRAPGFMATTVGTIALGIGATVAIFAVVDAVLLDPLPYDDADELVAVWEWHQPRDRRKNVANPGNFQAWRDRSSTFEAMTAMSLLQPTKLTGGDEPQEVMTQYAGPDFFAVLGLDAALGRTFTADLSSVETTEVVLSDRYWRQRMGADPEVVGRTYQLNETPVVVVGVLPPEYVAFGEGADLWASIDLEISDQTNSGRWLMVLGRLADGATVEMARGELETIATRLEEEFPEFNAGWTVNLVPLQEEIVGDVRAMLWLLLGAVGVLLLIACGNVANLFLVRATARKGEMAVRRSLGATSADLAGQLMAESVLISAVGAVLGVGVAHAAVRWIATSMPDAFGIPRIGGAAIDPTVLAFAAAVTVGTALLFGLLPGLQSAWTRPGSILGAEERGPSRGVGRIRNVLVVGEVALSVVLLVGASLLVQSFMALTAVDDGIEPENVVVGRVNLSGNQYDGRQVQTAFFQELVSNISARPGVEAVGGITFLPMDGLGAATSYWPSDRATPPADERRAADIRNVEGEYFDAMGVQLLQGRLFDDRDRDDAPQRVVVNRSLAELYWPDESAVGKSVVVSWVDRTPWEIVGVVEDVRIQGPGTPPRETIYMPYSIAPFFPWLHIVARGPGPSNELTSAIRSELAALDDALPLGSVRIMEDIVNRSIARPRVTGVLMLIFAGMATLLAAVGLYGILAYAVSRRVREIGVRIALGAQPRSVLALVVGQGTRLVLLGLVLGAAASLAVQRFLESLLFQVDSGDPRALLAAGLVLASVSLLACAIPAWRASRVAPVEALRPE